MKTPIATLLVIFAALAAALTAIADPIQNEYVGQITATLTSGDSNLDLGQVFQGSYAYFSSTIDGQFDLSSFFSFLDVPYEQSPETSYGIFYGGSFFDNADLDVQNGQIVFMDASSDFGYEAVGDYWYNGTGDLAPSDTGGWSLYQPDIGFGSYYAEGTLTMTDPELVGSLSQSFERTVQQLPDNVNGASILALGLFTLATTANRIGRRKSS